MLFIPLLIYKISFRGLFFFITDEIVLGTPGFNWCFSFAPEFVSYWALRDLHRRTAYSIYESSFLIHHGVYHDLFVCP